MAKFNVVLMRGLLGEVYSKGMDTLGAKLAKLPNVDYVTVEDYANWRSIRDRLTRWRDKSIIGGHSFGANAATIIAESLPKLPIPMLLSFDPSQYWSWRLFQKGPSFVPQSVGRVVNYYQNGFPIGYQQLRTGDNDLLNMRVETTHTEIDDIPMLHDLAIKEVQKIINA